MTLKTLLPALALAFMVSISSVYAQAQPADSQDMNKIRDAHRQKMAPLHDQYWKKQMEYDFLVNSPNTKLAEVKAVIDEMGALKAKIRTERQGMVKEMKGKGYSRPNNNGGDCRNSGYDNYGHKGGHNGGMMGHNGGNYNNYGHNGGMMGHNR